MNEPELTTRYRNLLIILARDAEEIRLEVNVISIAAPAEPFRSKRNGMFTIVNARNRQRARLLQILSRNGKALRHFFGTTDPEVVAKNEILFAPIEK